MHTHQWTHSYTYLHARTKHKHKWGRSLVANPTLGLSVDRTGAHKMLSFHTHVPTKGAEEEEEDRKQTNK